MAWTWAEVAASSEEGEVAASSEEAGEGAEADGTSTSSRGPGSFGPGTRQGPDAGSVSVATPTGVVGRSATAATLQSQVVQSMCPELAWKITGKLLEYDNAELLLMLEDNNSLKKKVSPDNTALLYHTYTSLQVKMAMIQQQRIDLGEQLFPLVEKIRPDLARKITGMLLQIDHAELVLMMEDPTSLKGKVRPDTSFIVISLVHPNTLLQVEEAVAVLQKNKEENMLE